MKAARSIAVAIALASCDAQVRPQVLLAIDTDVPVVGQLDGTPDPSPAAAIDTVRVEILRSDGTTADRRDFIAPDPRDWPLTLGVPSDPMHGTVRLRIRAFRGASADPDPHTAIDRLVVLALPAYEGIVRQRITLHGECMGAPSSFIGEWTTCIAEPKALAAPSSGIAVDAGETSAIGTFSRAHPSSCSTAPEVDRVCIPGGLTVLGESLLRGVDDDVQPTPALPVWVSPFRMDVTEYTVGRFRTLRKTGKFKGVDPSIENPNDPLTEGCDYLGPDDGSRDAWPLNCTGFEAAREICNLEGGDLPTEAEWEHAARGRGLGRIYPWEGTTSTCCTASVYRETTTGGTCKPSGIEPVGSHRPNDTCNGLGDETIDGVLDMGGSMRELVLGAPKEYSHACWGVPGLRIDPQCVAPSIYQTTRGGDWSSGTGLARTTLRSSTAFGSLGTGFRCVSH